MRSILTLFALLATMLSLFAWTFGEPPAWTRIAPTATVTVVAARIDELGIRPNWQPVVTVRQGDGVETELAGIGPRFVPEDAAQVLAQWQVGTEVAVRTWDGRSWPSTTAHDGLALVIGTLTGLTALATWSLLVRIGYGARRRPNSGLARTLRDDTAFGSPR